MSLSASAAINPVVSLHRLALHHAADLFDTTQRNRRYLRQWLPWLDLIVSIDDTRRYIVNTIEAAEQGLRYSYIVEYQQQVVGIVSFHDMDRINRRAAIGYWLCEAFTGQGLMTTAVSVLCRKGFGDFGLNRIEIYCATENTKSRAIAERLGFQFEGILRQREWLYSGFVDHALYALTRDQRDQLN